MHIKRCFLALAILLTAQASLQADESAESSTNLAQLQVDVQKILAIPSRTYFVRAKIGSVGVTEWGKLTLTQEGNESQLRLQDKFVAADMPLAIKQGSFDQTSIVEPTGVLGLKNWKYILRRDFRERSFDYEGKPISVLKYLGTLPPGWRGRIVIIGNMQGEVGEEGMQIKFSILDGRPSRETRSKPFAADTLTPFAFLRLVTVLPAETDKVYEVSNMAFLPDLSNEWSQLKLQPLTLQYMKEDRFKVGSDEHDCRLFVLTSHPKKGAERKLTWSAWVDKDGVLQKFEIFQLPDTTWIGTLSNPGPIEGGDGYLRIVKALEDFSVGVRRQ